LPEGHAEIAKSSPLIVGLISAAAVMGILAVAAWFITIHGAEVKTSPLVVYACTVESFETADIGVTGGREDCDVPASGDNDLYTPESLPITVGLVCNNDSKPHTYQVRIEWWSLDQPGVTFVSLEAPIEFEEGCDVYEYQHTVPDALLTGVEPDGTDYGVWRIAGSAVPVDNDSLVAYGWDSTEAFRLEVTP